jgi:hypothetical protein
MVGSLFSHSNFFAEKSPPIIYILFSIHLSTQSSVLFPWKLHSSSTNDLPTVNSNGHMTWANLCCTASCWSHLPMGTLNFFGSCGCHFPNSPNTSLILSVSFMPSPLPCLGPFCEFTAPLSASSSYFMILFVWAHLCSRF